MYLKHRLLNSNKNRNLKTYQNYTRILRRCILHAQKIDNTRYILQSNNKCKAAWDIIKNNSTDSDNNAEITSIIDDQCTYTNADIIANKFNDFFINMTNKPNLPNSQKHIDYKHTITDISNTIFLTPTDEDTVCRIINSLNSTNSTGYDDINTNILKRCSKYISYPLAHIINLSLFQGVFPARLKFSIVKPLYKKGDKNDMNNYRPITLIPVISKIFERIMYDKLHSFILKHSILKEEQFGFRKNKSTTLACFSLVKMITSSLNKKRPMASVFLDMSKAFDFVDHKLLLFKLNCYGIRGNALQWIESYLNNRQQCVEISRHTLSENKTHRSAYRQNSCGVPQGSILGPFLFLLYINDLPNVTPYSCILYADDTTLSIELTDDNITKYEKEINDTLNKIIEWLNDNNLHVNISKTKLIQFQTYNSKRQRLEIRYANNAVEEVESATFLGITLDKYCNWKVHIDKLCTKLQRFVFVLNRITRVAGINAALYAYHGYVASVLRYGIIIWGNSVVTINAFRAQKKCIRSMTKAQPLQSCVPIFKKLRILPLPSLYIFELCIFVRKNLALFQVRNDVVIRKSRDIHKLCVPPQRIKLFSNNVYCMAIQIYNKLPNIFKSLNITTFKNKLFNFLLQKCYYSTNEFLNERFDSKFKLDDDLPPD